MSKLPCRGVGLDMDALASTVVDADARLRTARSDDCCEDDAHSVFSEIPARKTISKSSCNKSYTSKSVPALSAQSTRMTTRRAIGGSTTLWQNVLVISAQNIHVDDQRAVAILDLVGCSSCKEVPGVICDHGVVGDHALEVVARAALDESGRTLCFC